MPAVSDTEISTVWFALTDYNTSGAFPYPNNRFYPYLTAVDERL